MWLGIPIIRRAAHDRSPVGTLLLAALLAGVFAQGQWSGGASAQVDALGLVAGAYEPMRAFTANLAHFGVGHLVGNLIFLLPFGDGVEQRLGPVGVWALFFGVGTLALSLEAAVWDAAGNPTLRIAGASGGVAALVGACVLLQPDARIFMRLGVRGVDVPIAVYGGLEFVSQAFLAVMGVPGVAYVAHATGMAAGALAGYGLRRVLPPAPMSSPP
jgi:membrane associated rhomboid family serine protease